MRPWTWTWDRWGFVAARACRLALCVAVALVASAGCETEERHVGGPGASAAKDKDKAPAGPKAPAKKEPTFIVGRRTQEIKNAQTELGGGKARVASTKIVAKDPITLPGNAYVTIIGQTAMFSIQHALDLYQATNGNYPKDYDEFMNEIIKANNIALPQLPFYQKYGYDAAQHKLIVLEYPELKAQPGP